jgi:hypothetical protein
MNKKKQFPCIHCGVDDENVKFVSSGEKAEIMHTNPFHCIKNLKKQIEDLKKETRKAVIHSTTFGGPR